MSKDVKLSEQSQSIRLQLIDYLLKQKSEDLAVWIPEFLRENRDKFSVWSLYEFVNNLSVRCLGPALKQQCLSMDLANERAVYVKRYLDGDLYTSEEAAREALPRQQENAKKIVEFTGGAI